MLGFRHLITIPISLFAFITTFYSIGKLISFLSTPHEIKREYTWILSLLDNYSRLQDALYPLAIDLLLIVSFILQHSFLKEPIIENLWDKLGLATLSRSIYNLASAATLLLLIKHWIPVPTFILWRVDIQNPTIWWAFTITHGIGWTIIFGGSLLMDLPEMLGVKQVYYDLNNVLEPIAYKSWELKKLYSHVRHPSFLGFTLILWCVNLMSLDRLLLAILWTIYMYVAWSTDSGDVAYHKCQMLRKKRELYYME